MTQWLRSARETYARYRAVRSAMRETGLRDRLAIRLLLDLEQNGPLTLTAAPPGRAWGKDASIASFFYALFLLMRAGLAVRADGRAALTQRGQRAAELFTKAYGLEEGEQA